jgi:hypothetical protein
MKKVLFAAFAGLCLMTTMMSNSTVKKTNCRRSVSQVLRDSVPPKKDTSKFAELYVLADTITPKKDTTKFAELYVVRDTVPPKKDTSKMIVELYALK